MPVPRPPVPERFRPLVEATTALAERFSGAGHSLYLVGGSVRDALVEGPRGRPGPADEDFDFDLTTDARPDEIEALVSGWADAVWTQGKRFGTIGARHAGRRYRDHHPPGRGLPARLAQARRHLRRRHRRGPGPARLHGERHGPGPPGADPGRPVRRDRRPGGRTPPHPPRARRVVRRRPVADAAGGPVHRRLRPRARPGPGRSGSPGPPPPRDRLGRAHPRRARQAGRGAQRVGRPVVRRRHRAGGRVRARAARPRPRAGPDPPPQRRPGPHPGRGGQDLAGPPVAPGRPLPRRRQAPDPGLRPGRGDVPPPRGGRGPHDPRSAWRPCATRARTSRPS